MLPDAELATTDPAKLRDYLLSPSHPVGRFKAAVFHALGYTQQSWPRLQADLLALAQSNPAVAGLANDFGQLYEVSGKLQCPNGQSAWFLSVWMVKSGETIPRFVTAYPR